MSQGNFSSEGKIIKLLEENLKYNKEIYEICKKTNRYIFWIRIWSIVRILLIVVPVILAIIYLPPLIKSYIAPYQELLKSTGGSSQVEFLKQLKSLQGTEQLKNLLNTR